jgi:hypothetical protein
MRLSKESLTELKNRLSRGSNKVIRERLKKKGFKYCQQYISSCLNPDHSDYKDVIVEEAILLVEEEAIQLYELHHRIILLAVEAEVPQVNPIFLETPE